ASAALAAERPTWRMEKGDVRVTVPLKPGGAFEATSSALAGTLALDVAKPAHLAGEVALDLSTIDTGIALRNQHLRENYLEVAKGAGYDKAVLSDIHLADADGEAFAGSSAFTGTMLLHGVKHEVAGRVEVRPEGSGRHVRVEFPLNLTDFGVAPPEYLGVGVGSKLLVKVQLTAVPSH
ncbi:MAG TPA: YceI family protein, partial [Vicinamibacteria bacterium]|nr:YceI family protein [Vicinamibacteria bacterium]